MPKPETHGQPTRIPQPLLDRAERLAKVLADDPDVLALGGATRARMIRLAIVEGLRVLERRAGRSAEDAGANGSGRVKARAAAR